MSTNISDDGLAESIAVPINKLRILYFALPTTLGVSLGVSLIWVAQQDVASSEIFPLLILGILITVVSGIGLILSLRLLFHRSAGLILNAEGLYDNSSAASVGLIPWRDVTSIFVSPPQLYAPPVLHIFVRDPKAYVRKCKLSRRVFAWLNWKMYGSPLSLATYIFKIDHDDLLREIRRFLKRYGSFDEY